MRKLLCLLSLLLVGCTAPTTPGPTTSGNSTPSPVAVVDTPGPETFEGTSAKAHLTDERRDLAPVRLTASDGTGLNLVGMKSRAVISGPLAFTELHLTFENPNNRVLEGRFEITLPQGAAISRFAARKDAQNWQEAEVVELQAARRAYEDALHRRQDPALLEKQAGNQFQARIFPIPANAQKELIISYSQELTSNQDYILPLAGLPSIASLDASAMVWTDPTRKEPDSLRLERQGEAPKGDWVIHRTSPVQALCHQKLVVFEVAPDLDDKPQPVKDLLVLFDTSASRAAGYASQVDMLSSLISKVAPDRLEVACFDQEVKSLYKGSGAKYQATELKARRPLGATDLSGALTWASQQKGFKRLLVVTDGVSTAGPADLAAAGSALKSAGFQRCDVLLVGGIRDSKAIEPLVAGTLPQTGVCMDGDRPVAELSHRVQSVASAGLHPEVKGALWVWPESLDGLQPGDARLVYAEMKEPTQKLEVTLGKVHKTPALYSALAPLLERAAAQAQIARLEAQLPGLKEDAAQRLRTEIVGLSTHNRVVSSLTAMLVLETDADYARFGIDRKALSDIMVVGQKGIELVHRDAPVVPKPIPQVVENKPVFNGLARDPMAPPVGMPGVRHHIGAPAAGMPARAMRSETYAKQSAAAPMDNEARPMPQTEQGMVAAEDARDQPGDGAMVPQARQAQLQKATTAGGMAGSLGGAPSAPVAAPQAMAGAPAYNAGSVSAEPAPDGPPSSGTQAHSVGANSPHPVPVAGRIAYAQRVHYPPPINHNNLRQTEVPASDDDSFSVHHNPHQRYNSVLQNSSVPGVLGGVPALSGKMAEIMDQLKAGKKKEALAASQAWQSAEPGDVGALIALGESLEAVGQPNEAARVYGSIIDLYPSRADLRRFAACHLESLGKLGQQLAKDSFEKAVEQRPDHPSGHRMLAYARLRLGDLEGAFQALETGLKQQYPPGRFLGYERVLGDDIGLVGACWIAKDPKRSKEIRERLEALGALPADAPSTRFVLTWETDANDVDFHIQDGQHGHAYYASPRLPSGGQLYADVTTGYGPECFCIDGKPPAFPYRLSIHYYSRGPMGYGMGKVEVVQYDGAGHLKFDERPFIVMNDQAFVDLGLLKAPL